MVKVRKEEIFVAFLDMEKAYDRVNRNKLFEVMRCYGVHEKLVRLIERIYDGSMVKFELEKVTLELGRAAHCHLSFSTYMSGN